MKKKPKTEIVGWKMPMIRAQKEIEKQNSSLLKTAGGFLITTEDHFNAAWILVQNLDAAMRRVADTFDPIVSAAHKLHKMVKAVRDGFYDPLDEAKEALMKRRYAYREQQEQIRRDAEAKLAAGLQAQQKKDLEKQAKAAERTGNLQFAAVLREQKEAVPLPVIKSEPAVPKNEGSVIRERWIYTIVDPAAVEREFCSPDDKLIRPVVEALGPACKISGLKIEKDVSEHSRRVSV